MTMPRIFKYAFNPVSFFLCFGSDDRILCIVAEVNNTFSERHHYILSENSGKAIEFPATFERAKEFHVSPFNNMQGNYVFQFTDPNDEFSATITLYRNQEIILFASIRVLPVRSTLTVYICIHFDIRSQRF